MIKAKKIIYIGIIFLFFSCEYWSHTVINKTLPVSITVIDAQINNLSIECKRNEQFVKLLEIEYVSGKSVNQMKLDSLPIGYKYVFGEYNKLDFIPNNIYAVSVRTDKGYSEVRFKVDDSGNIKELSDE
jgi:hypothetical protein